MAIFKKNSVLRSSSAILGALLCAAGASGQTNTVPPETNAPPAIEASLRPGEIIGAQQIQREFIKCGTNEFMFTLPDELRVEAANKDSLVMASRDGKLGISIRFSPPPVAIEEDPHKAWLESIAQRYPGAKTLEEFSVLVAGKGGDAIQLEQKASPFSTRFLRIIRASFQAGILEFTLNADETVAGVGQRVLSEILTSFCTNEDGKIKIIPRTDKS